MKLSEWAKKNGITYRTAWKWYKAGKLPVPAEQTPTGTILVKEGSLLNGKVALYARVSRAEKKTDLDGQISRLLTYANKQGWEVGKAVAEVGSGLNGHRPELMKLLTDPKIKMVVVEHKERLVRFGFEYIEAALSAQGRQIVVVGQTELKDDLLQDMLAALNIFCASLYDRRTAADKVKKAMKAIVRGD